MLTDPFQLRIGFTAENVAAKHAVSRLEQDQLAAESQHRAAAQGAKLPFAQEIIPIATGGRTPTTVAEDDVSGLTPADIGVAEVNEASAKDFAL